MSPNGGYEVDVPALKTYAGNMDFYTSEADKFGDLINQAEVPDEAWGLVGLMAKGSYSEKLTELQDLLATMKDGVETFTDKLNTAAAVYEGNEEATSISFGGETASLD